MNSKEISSAEISSVFFEIGLALKLRKITFEEAKKYFSPSKLYKLSSKIEEENEFGRWDDSEVAKGDRLKAALEAHEVSQAELAKKIGTTNQKINDLIKGRITLSVQWAKKIGAALNVNYKVFL